MEIEYTKNHISKMCDGKKFHSMTCWASIKIKNKEFYIQASNGATYINDDYDRPNEFSFGLDDCSSKELQEILDLHYSGDINDLESDFSEEEIKEIVNMVEKFFDGCKNHLKEWVDECDVEFEEDENYICLV